MVLEKYIEKIMGYPATPLIATAFVMLIVVTAIIGISKRVKENKKRRRSKKAFRYEYDVAHYLRRHMFWNVKVTKASGDYGVDVTARKGLFRKYAVQCKYYSSPVGVSAVQEVVAGMRVYNCNRCMVVTNNVFTKPAQKLAEENDVILLAGVRA
jgi:HJR/Mrr/RecB family endonuclease